MSPIPSSKKCLALVSTLSVFATVLAFTSRPVSTAPISDPWHLKPVMFGSDPSRNLVNLLDKNLPTNWNIEPGKERNVLWSVPLGTKAYGGPIIHGGKIFIGTNNGNPRDPKIVGDKGVMMCFEEKTGKFLWQAAHDKLPAGRVSDWPEIGIASTPAVEKDRLYYVSNRCEVICASTEGLAIGTADIIWRLDMIGDLKVWPHSLASCSPLLVGDRLFVVTGNGVDQGHRAIPNPAAPSFIAINKQTGRLLWQDSSPGANIRHGQWSNPVHASVRGTPIVIFPGGDGWLYAFDPPTGKLVWKFDCNPKGAAFVVGPKSTWNHFVATPVVWENKLYIGVGEDPEHLKGEGHLWCVDLIRAVAKGPTNAGRDVSPVGNNFDPKALANANSALAWHYGGLNPAKKPRFFHFGRTLSTCAVHDGLVYASEYDGWLHCFGALTGEKYWDHDMATDNWASPYWVDGKIYLGNENGDVLVFEHGKKKKLLGTVETGASYVRTPLLARNGVLYLVTENPCKLYALKER